MSLDSPPRTKDPARVRAGHAGMRARWGVPRTAQLHDFTPAERELLLAMIEAARNAKQKAADPGAGQG